MNTSIRATLSLLFALEISGCASHPLQREAAALNTRAAQQLARGDADGAEASLHVALEYNPRYAEAHSNLGLVALTRGRPAEAIPHLTRAVQLNPDFAEAWNNLGVAHQRLAPLSGPSPEIDGALRAFRAALAINPGLTDARVNLVRVLLRTRSPETLDQARRLVQLTDAEPTGAVANMLRAEAALMADQIEEAHASADEALRRAPDDPEARLVAARVQLARGMRAEGITALEALVDAAPVANEARVWLSAARLSTGDVNGARSALDSAGSYGAAHPVGVSVRQAIQESGE